MRFNLKNWPKITSAAFLCLAIIFVINFSPKTLETSKANRAPASIPTETSPPGQDCQTGINTLVGGEKCPENCADPADFPGYDPKNPASFSRSQDTVGYCAAFSSAEYLCYMLKRIKMLPETPEYIKGCSALDLEIQAFSELEPKYKKDKNTIDEFLSPKNTLTENLNSYYLIATKKGICPESAFPSEFRGNGTMTVKNVYLAMAKHFKEKKESTEAGVSLIGLCPECSIVAPDLTATQWQQIEQVLTGVNDLNKNDFEVLRKINEIACPPEKRIKYPVTMGIDSSAFVDLNAKLKNPGAITTVSLAAHYLNPKIQPGPNDDKDKYDAHLAIIYGTVPRLVNGKGVCFYAMKNSWGPSACKERLPDLMCDKENGTYYVSRSLLKKAMGEGGD